MSEGKERESITSSTTIISDGWMDRDSQTGWQNIHEKITTYRSANKVTIKHFLLLCELPPNRSYYQQLCSSYGKNMHPSDKSSSPGHLFLNAVKKFFGTKEASRLSLPSLAADTDIDAEVCDLRIDHGEELRELGGCSLSFEKEKQKITVNCLSSTVEDRVRDRLKQNLDVEKLTIELRRMELLCSPPPHTLIANLNEGSAEPSPVHRWALLALTALPRRIL